MYHMLVPATNNRYADSNNLRLVNLALIALFRNYTLTTGSEKHLEDIRDAHFVSLLYKLITSSGDSADLSIHFD